MTFITVLIRLLFMKYIHEIICGKTVCKIPLFYKGIFLYADRRCIA